MIVARRIPCAFTLSQSFRRTTGSPLRYLILAWAALIGYLVWGQLPNFWAWVGIAMILAAGFLAIASSLRPVPAVSEGV